MLRRQKHVLLSFVSLSLFILPSVSIYIFHSLSLHLSLSLSRSLSLFLSISLYLTLSLSLSMVFFFSLSLSLSLSIVFVVHDPLRVHPIQGEIVYVAPFPPPPFLAIRHLQEGGGWAREIGTIWQIGVLTAERSVF